ncbi:MULTISPECIES: hypothetical protein [Moorena]|uniref:Uncharacterized protein n=1 Tax=Moorena producens 3L TaxID=489825 RepID=F4Y217_9CYAN|nr:MULTISPECIES: hypothetical protein [Moorena]NEQ13591.1 hypothetical protein [Moorena sp. SIO3E2]EGJ29309.1 hypothetical protein LYNGBM3L_67250 [Moorena producens 3L]NEP35453.1 hypothetical protein [Moorena sp. SIO3B2]NEP67366.1 hypothetical protein [Moorena sp. SIO3A5]NEQ09667.1 hypothetical protein [Moorena sp. SIO4E2]
MYTNFIVSPFPNQSSEIILPASHGFYPYQEPIKHTLTGSKRAIYITIRNLQTLGYATVSEWSPLQRTYNPGEYICILQRNLILD